jgi:hypothetical protein
LRVSDLPAAVTASNEDANDDDDRDNNNDEDEDDGSVGMMLQILQQFGLLEVTARDVIVDLRDLWVYVCATQIEGVKPAVVDFSALSNDDDDDDDENDDANDQEEEVEYAAVGDAGDGDANDDDAGEQADGDDDDEERVPQSPPKRAKTESNKPTTTQANAVKSALKTNESKSAHADSAAKPTPNQANATKQAAGASANASKSTQQTPNQAAPTNALDAEMSKLIALARPKRPRVFFGMSVVLSGVGESIDVCVCWWDW